ncbi:MAG: hypothetical protein COS89_07840 [Deltaproteobacteria bacterium CG07_land_8_20_14_0_80_38_7]|nr:MAG: hypothetical protein COS89_07840 [Deltaproteobacteria bacterium CG07_land_8_20_14_0_80_38_7]
MQNIIANNKRTMAIAGGILAGMLTAVAIRVNASLGEYVGVLESAFIVHVVGTIFGLLLISRSLNKIFINRLKATPKHLLTGGLLGVGIVVISNIIVSKLGTTLSVGLFITSMLTFSCIADHFGFFSLPKFRFSKQRLIGLLCTIIGLILLIQG